jgi:hypothetical protein
VTCGAAVDNGKAAMGKCDASVLIAPNPLVVGATVNHGISHAHSQRLKVMKFGILYENSCYATHVILFT